jgi:hypothetical protein
LGLLSGGSLEHPVSDLLHRADRNDHHGERDSYNHDNHCGDEDEDDHCGGVHFNSFHRGSHYKLCIFYEKKARAGVNGSAYETTSCFSGSSSCKSQDLSESHQSLERSLHRRRPR